MIQHIPQLSYFSQVLFDSIPNHAKKFKGLGWSFLLDTISMEKEQLEESLDTFSKILFKGAWKNWRTFLSLSNSKDHYTIPKLWYIAQKLSNIVSPRVPLKQKGWKKILLR